MAMAGKSAIRAREKRRGMWKEAEVSDATCDYLRRRGAAQAATMSITPHLAKDDGKILERRRPPTLRFVSFFSRACSSHVRSSC